MPLRSSFPRILEASSSMKTGLVLLGLVALASAAGSLVPEWGTAIYGSWPFIALLCASVLSTGICAFTRRPGLAKALDRSLKPGTRLRYASIFCMHLSVLLVAAAGIWAALAFSSRDIKLAEGESLGMEGRQLRLDSIQVQRYSDNSVSDWIAVMAEGSNRYPIRVNHPLQLGASKLLVSGYSQRYSARLAIPARGFEKKLSIEEGALLPLDREASIGLRLSPAAGSQAGKDFQLELIAEGQPVQKMPLNLGTSVMIGQSGVNFTADSSQALLQFTLRRTPGLDFVWLGLAVMALSSFGIFLGPANPVPEGEKR